MTKTEAFKKVDAYRDEMHQGDTKVQAKDLSSTVYLAEWSGAPIATLYVGKAMKSFKRFRYSSEASRAESVAKWMASQSERQAAKKQRQKPSGRELVVGDVLVCSWGYDQTNVDYYKVVALVGTSTVELVEIGKEQNETLHMQGLCIPDPNAVIGAPFRKRANGESVKINSHSWARKKKTETLPGGVEVFTADRWSSYH